MITDREIIGSAALLLSAMLAGCSVQPDQTAANINDAAADQAEIRAKVDEYAATVGDLDMERISRVWSTTPEVSFIQPRGEQHGWGEISQVFYGQVMGQNFTRRELQIEGEPEIAFYGDSAVVLFDWVFDATRADTGEAIQTRGRETQVYVDLADLGWRLVHVHYSGPPVTGAGQGF
jgi:ketosteroid isomerase-like protein